MIEIDNDNLIIFVTETLTDDDMAVITSQPTYKVKATDQLHQEFADYLGRELITSIEMEITTTLNDSVLVVNNNPRQVQYLMPEQPSEV